VRCNRTDFPVAIKGATEWAGSPLQTADGLLNLLRSQPEIRKRLIQLASLSTIEGGRPRLRGHWPIAYLLFVASGEPTFKRWLTRTDHRMWQRCGFLFRPKYDTVYRNFCQLEERADAFRVVAIALIENAIKQTDGLVGRDIHIDGTEAESNARVYHVCKPHQCPKRKGPGRSPVKKTPTVLAQAERQAKAGQIPDPSNDSEIKDITPLANGTLFEMKSGCLYSTSDPDAGLRSYGAPGRSRNSIWVGFINLKAVDHMTGAVLATLTVPANVNEEKAYPHLLNKVIETTGIIPRAVVGDRGFSRREVYELNTKMGIATVVPWRRHKKGEERDTVGTDYYDQHGIPLCQKCHGPGSFVRFQAGPRPRLWFECENGCGPGSVVCSRGWRYLVPLWRTEEAYLALRHSHSNYENTHWRWRDQWLVGPDTVTNRPRRRGIGCQTLRAEAALLLEWLLVSWREGWAGSHRRNTETPFKRRARHLLERFERSRVAKGLHLPRATRLAQFEAGQPPARTG
jgi:hypothetical protein